MKKPDVPVENDANELLGWLALLPNVRNELWDVDDEAPNEPNDVKLYAFLFMVGLLFVDEPNPCWPNALWGCWGSCWVNGDWGKENKVDWGLEVVGWVCWGWVVDGWEKKGCWVVCGLLPNKDDCEEEEAEEKGFAAVLNKFGLSEGWVVGFCCCCWLLLLVVGWDVLGGFCFCWNDGVLGVWKRDGLGSSFGFDSCGLVFGVLGVVSFGSGGFPNILGENKEDVVLELEPPKEKAEFWRGCVSFFGSSFLGSSFFVSLLLLLLSSHFLILIWYLP